MLITYNYYFIKFNFLKKLISVIKLKNLNIIYTIIYKNLLQEKIKIYNQII